MDIIQETSRQFGQGYFQFVIIILTINAIAKSVFQTKLNNSTRPVVLLFSALVMLIFWSFGAKIGKLFIFMFFAFGFWDWVGKYIEKIFILLFAFAATKLKAIWKRITTLYNK